MEKMTVNATYEVIATFDKVEVKFPGTNDPHLKFIPAHKIETPENGITKISPHYRRGDIFNGHFLTRNFFVDPSLRGQTIVVDRVKVVKKTDHARNQEVIILDIIQDGLGRNNFVPLFRLKFGTPEGDFEIPGSNGRFIKFEEVKPRG